MLALHNHNFEFFFLFIFIVFLIGERIIFIAAPKNRKPEEVYYPWLTYLPFATYIAIAAYVLFEGLFLATAIDLYLFLMGLTIYFCGAYLRWAARQALGDLWSIQIEIKRQHRYIRSGIYRYLRHPYSVSVMCELLGLSIMFGSWVGCIAVLIIQLPLLIIRNRKEDDLLETVKSGAKLQRGTIFEVINKFGLAALFEFAAINNAMKHYNRYYMLTSCIMALLNVGFFDALKAKKTIDIRAYAKESNLDFGVLNTICGYLMAQGILKKRGKIIYITNRGTFLSEKCKGIFDFVTAYQPIFDNLEDVLKGKVKYGRDIFRRGKYVATASADLAKKFTFPIIKSVIAERKFDSVLDLGCGSGEFLEVLAALPQTKLFGIDISNDAIDYAKSRLKRDNIKLEVCDLFDLVKLKQITTIDDEEPSVITSIFVFHELAERGFEKLINYLMNLRKKFPNSYVLVYELFLHRWHKLKRISSAIREHHLFHYLSNQTLLSIDNWQNVFRASGYQIEEQKLFENFGQGYFLLHPNKSQ